MPNKILISHFWNEEVLLPFWLKHHVPMFDHGILIDYDSTDMSVEIIKKLAPNWEIRRSRNKEFDAEMCDTEVMDIEKEFIGWKMVLNTTEFVLCNNLDSMLKDLEAKRQGAPTVILVPGHIIVDTPQEKYCRIDYSIPLLKQRHYGISAFEDMGENGVNRQRFMHNKENGNYIKGRHAIIADECETVNLFGAISLAWVYWALYGATLVRKLSIQQRFSKRDLTLTNSNHVLNGPEELEERYEQYAKLSRDLIRFEPAFYGKLIQALPERY